MALCSKQKRLLIRAMGNIYAKGTVGGRALETWGRLYLISFRQIYYLWPSFPFKKSRDERPMHNNARGGRVGWVSWPWLGRACYHGFRVRDTGDLWRFGRGFDRDEGCLKKHAGWSLFEAEGTRPVEPIKSA